ncbi:hypothetical protein GYA13_01715, partial [Candidatus Kuenenbacteria bacterium]|nr:hypothetical protein [Candidatus Kuenenbacteria bacterium]
MKNKNKNKMPYKVDNNINNNIKTISGYKGSRAVPHGYFLLSELESQCSYSQEYLSLLARKGELKAKKFGRNWYSTKEFLAEYIRDHAAESKEQEKTRKTAVTSKVEKTQEGENAQLEKAAIANSTLRVMEREKSQNGERKDFLKSKIENIKNKIKKWLSAEEQKYRESVREVKILERQLIIQKVVDKVARTEGKKLAAEKKSEIKLYYPMSQGLNRAILEEVKDLVEQEAGFSKVRANEWFKLLVSDRARGILFNLRVAIADFWQAPRVAVKYWSVSGVEYKFKTAAYGLAMFLFLFISGASILDYQWASKNYEQTAVAVKENSQKFLATWSEKNDNWQEAQTRATGKMGRALDKQLAMVGDKEWPEKTEKYFQKAGVETVEKKDRVLAMTGQVMDQNLAELADGADEWWGQRKNNREIEQNRGLVAGETTINRTRVAIAKVDEWWQRGKELVNTWGKKIEEVIWPIRSEEIYLAENTRGQCYLNFEINADNPWLIGNGTKTIIAKNEKETTREKETVIREIVYQGPPGPRGETGPPGPQGEAGAPGSAGQNIISNSSGGGSYIYPNVIAQPTIDPHSATSLSAMNLSGETLVVKMATVGEDLTVGRNATIGGIFNATGAAIFGGAVSFNSQTNFAGPATFNMINASSSSVDNLIFGNATTTGTLAVNEICIGGECQNAWPASGTSGAWENIFDNTLSPTSTTAGIFVTGSSTIAADFRVDGNATTTGSQYVGGDLIVIGGANLDGLTTIADARVAVLNATSSLIDNLVVSNSISVPAGSFDYTSLNWYWSTTSEQYFWNNTSTWSGFQSEWNKYTNASSTLITLNDIDTSLKISDIVGDETGTGSLVFGTSPVISGATLNGLSTIADARVAVLNATSSTIDNLVVTNSLSLPAGSFDYTSLNWYWSTTSEQYFWNNTTTWSGFESNWNNYTNASSTLITE